MRNLLVYLGEVVYETTGAEFWGYPLNIGFLKSYAVKELGDRVDIRLFVRTDELCNDIKTNPPDILALSNYLWNTSLSEKVFRYSKNVNRDIITVAGGPNYPTLKETKEAYWQERHGFLDFFIFGEGELTFCELLRYYLENPGRGKASIKISGLDYWDPKTNTVSLGSVRERIKNLDATLPSPILSGTLDEFIHMKPMIQGVRGCPYACRYCHMGLSYFNKINPFSYERVVSEAEYVRKKNTSHYHIGITDDNFGILERDALLVEYFIKSYQDTGWPIQVMISTAKRMNKHFIDVAPKASHLIRLHLHFQSVNDNTLKFIKTIKPTKEELRMFRDNFGERSNYASNTALIIPMPYETYETYFEGLRRIIEDCEFEQCNVFTLVVFWGNVFEDKSVRDEFNMKIKYRFGPDAFGEFRNFSSYEVEEVCVGTGTFSEEEYYKARLFYCFCSIFYFKKNFYYMRRYIKGVGLSVFDWISYLFEHFHTAGKAVKAFFNEVDNMTRDELFDTREEMQTFWDNPENRRKCMRGEFGFNIIHMALSNLRLVYNEIVDYAAEVTKKYFTAKNVQFNKEIDELSRLTKYQRLSGLEERDVNKDIIDSFSYDFVKWEEEKFSKPLSSYFRHKNVKIAVAFSDKQKEDLANLVKAYQKDHAVSTSKFYYKTNPSQYNRKITYSTKSV